MTKMCPNAPNGCVNDRGVISVIDSFRSRCGVCGGYLDPEPPLYAPKSLNAFRAKESYAYEFDVTTGPAPVAGIVFDKDPK